MPTTKKIAGISWMLWGFILTSLTYFLGAPALKAVRTQIGRVFYWSIVFVVGAAGIGIGFSIQAHYVIGLTLMFLSLAALIGLFCEFEESGLSLVWSSFWSILISACFVTGGLGIWFSVEGQGLVKKASELLSPALSSQPQLGLTFEKVMGQAPSLIIILWMLAIYSAVILESRIRIQPQPHSKMRQQLFNLKANGILIWIFIASLIPAFSGVGSRGVEVAAINILNICMAFFFFQGLGIIHQLLLALRLGLFWHILLTVFLMVQLFIFVSLLGLADYWMDFRSKLIKRKKSQLETYNRREK